MSRPPYFEDEGAAENWLALDYALGVSDAAERREAEERAAREPAFAAEIQAWTARLAPFIDEIAGVEPSPELWRRIQAAVGGGEVIDFAAHRVASRESAERLTRRASVWRGATVGAFAVAAALALLVIGLILPGRPAVPRPSPPPLLVAELQVGTGTAFWAAAYDPLRRQMLLQLPAGAAPAGRAAELWIIGPDGKPAALGVARSGALDGLTLTPAQAGRMRTASVLAVSIEPPGGSTTGLPTGPVVAKGALRPA